MDQVRENITNFINSVHATYAPKDWDILEFGCGVLWHNKTLFGKDNRFKATDTYMSGPADEVADITNAPHLPSDYYDLVVVSEVLEHVYAFSAALQTCTRIVKPGGLLLITVPWEYPEHGEDYWRYSERTLDRLLEEHGFEVITASVGYEGDKKTNIFRLGCKQ